MTYSLYGGGNHGYHTGFTALSKAIGTPDSTDKDSAYITEHPVLKYFRAELANFLNDFRRADWHLVIRPIGYPRISSEMVGYGWTSSEIL